MNAPLIFLLAMTSTAGQPVSLVARGGDPAPGILVNRTIGMRPFDPPDPSKPTVVFIHGVNPAGAVLHFTMAQRLAEAMARRFGANAFNVLEWDWNGATVVSARRRPNTDQAIAQGRMFAAALFKAGIDPTRLHLVGQSAGCTVASSAARTIVTTRGVQVAQMTFLDPAGFTHEAVFNELTPGSSACRVENYWSGGPSAYGRATGAPGVIDIEMPQDAPLVGVVILTKSAHMEIVAWYIRSVEEPHQTLGFNTSLLLSR